MRSFLRFSFIRVDGEEALQNFTFTAAKNGGKYLPTNLTKNPKNMVPYLFVSLWGYNDGHPRLRKNIQISDAITFTPSPRSRNRGGAKNCRKNEKSCPKGPDQNNQDRIRRHLRKKSRESPPPSFTKIKSSLYRVRSKRLPKNPTVPTISR